MKPDELTNDDFLGGRLKLSQPKQGFRAGSDAVFLAAAVPARAGERALEVGAGAGAASLCLAWRVPGLSVTGLELQADIVEIAEANAEANRLRDRVRFLAGDLNQPLPMLEPESFDHVFANPPFFRAGRQPRSPHPGRAAARSEGGSGDLARWIDFMLQMLKPHGTLTMIQRADREAELVGLLLGRAVVTAIVSLQARPHQPAKRVIVRAEKAGITVVHHLSTLLLHQPEGGYTEAAEAVLRHAQALP